MVNKLKNIAVIIISSSIGLGSCENSNKKTQGHQPKNNLKNPEIQNRIKKNKESHINTSYQYVNRIGTIKHYKYDHEVRGTDEDGKEVKGNINIEGTNGEGELIKNNNAKIEIVVELITKGKLLATDVEGNEYMLKID